MTGQLRAVARQSEGAAAVCRNEGNLDLSYPEELMWTWPGLGCVRPGPVPGGPKTEIMITVDA